MLRFALRLKLTPLALIPLVQIPLVLTPLAGAAAKDTDADFAACDKGQVEVAAKASSFQGEARIKQLIDADLARAQREETEGDADECLEALDHAGKLIKGDY